MHSDADQMSIGEFTPYAILLIHARYQYRAKQFTQPISNLFHEVVMLSLITSE